MMIIYSGNSVFFFFSVFQLSCGTVVNVTKDGKLCLYANLMLNFSVTYETDGNKVSVWS